VDAVRESDADLEAFQSVDPDLEEVFVELTSDDDPTTGSIDLDERDNDRPASPPKHATDGGVDS
jgi:hypothetical protein